MQVSIVGAGYVGLCTGVQLARTGHDVVLVDKDPARLDAVASGAAPFFEPGLDAALAQVVREGRLRATGDLADAVAATEATFLCVGTPPDADGRIDLSFIHTAAAEVAEAARGKARRHGVIVKSTVLPGTLADLAARDAGACWYASNPEFLREGSALHDAAHPDRVLVGCRDADGLAWLRRLYADVACPLVEVDPAAAELAKYAANSMLATRIAFANEMANLCQNLGVDWYDVLRGIRDDPRIGGGFLRPGAGFGGSCFPKDVSALRHFALDAGRPSLLLDAVLRQNDEQPLRVVELLRDRLGDLRGKRVALLGLAFKPDTDDVRGTRALPIARALLDAGAELVCHDPRAAEPFRALLPEAPLAATPEEALRDADGCIVQTEWPAYRDLDPADLVRWMREPVVVDGRRVLDGQRLHAVGVTYRAIGDGRPLDPRPTPHLEVTA